MARKKTERIDRSNLKMLSIYAPEEVIKLVEREAAKESRSAGNMGRRLIEEALERRGVEIPQLAVV